MEISLNQDQLTKALNSCSRIATNKAGLPVLNNVLLRAEKNRVVVGATNLELASVSLIGAKITKQGSITVPAKLLSEYIANLPSGTIELSSKATTLHIKSGNYSLTLNGIDADEFPELPTIDEKESIHYSLNVQDYKQAISQTVFACSSDVTRPVLTGVFWNSYEGQLYLVGTDGYRLAERRLTATKSELAAIVPASTLQEVSRVIHDDTESIDVLFDETQVRFRVADTEITSRLIDGKYPDYRKLVPTNQATTAVVAHDDFVRVAKLASLFARNSGGSVNLTISDEKNNLTIQSVASELGENSSAIDAETHGEGKVSLNSRYLSEALAAIDSQQIYFGFSGALSPCVLRSSAKKPDYTHIIMPLKS
jgi:DNA polymerase III subunit beta